MFYTVECSYNDPESEAEWNAFYSQQKLPALISVAGFTTSQRFRALTSGCPVYLAIHTINDAEILSSEDYRLKGGGYFFRCPVALIGRSTLRTGIVTSMKARALLHPSLSITFCY